MMSKVLSYLNKHRTKPAKPKAKARGKSKKRAEPGSTPVEDLSLKSVHDPYEQMVSFQKLPIYTRHNPNEEVDDEDYTYNTQQTGSPPMALPVLSKKFIKHRLKDYQAGPVKIYTKAEIAEYERERAHGTEV